MLTLEGIEKKINRTINQIITQIYVFNSFRFEGEDLEYEERKKIMAAQKNAWLEQQVQERKAAEEERKQAEAAYMVTKILYILFFSSCISLTSAD